MLLEGFNSEADEIAKVVENPGIIRTYLDKYLPSVISFLIQVIVAVVILVVGIKLIKWVCKLINKALNKGNVEAGVITFLTTFIKYALYFVLVMFILDKFGVGTGSVVAILGSAGLTVGLALQGSLANFAGGVLILIIKPFVVGDYIILGGDTEGSVEQISLFYTRLRTVDNKMIMIPNGTLSDSNITNVSTCDKRRVDVVVGVSYTCDLSKVKEVLRDTVNAQPCLLKDQPVDVFVSELADSSVNMGVRMWVSNENYWPAKWQLTEDIKNALDANSIEIPFPQLDVHVEK